MRNYQWIELCKHVPSFASSNSGLNENVLFIKIGVHIYLCLLKLCDVLTYCCFRITFCWELKLYKSSKCQLFFYINSRKKMFQALVCFTSSFIDFEYKFYILTWFSVSSLSVPLLFFVVKIVFLDCKLCTRQICM